MQNLGKVVPCQMAFGELKGTEAMTLREQPRPGASVLRSRSGYAPTDSPCVRFGMRGDRALTPSKPGERVTMNRRAATNRGSSGKRANPASRVHRGRGANPISPLVPRGHAERDQPATASPVEAVG